MKYEINIELIENPAGATIELPDNAQVLAANPEPQALRLYYMTPAPKPKKTDDAGRTTAERLEMLRNNDFGDNTEEKVGRKTHD